MSDKPLVLSRPPPPTSRVRIDPEDAPWERFFSVFPLVLVGTREIDGSHDIAPKHLAMPMAWGPWFGFVCTPAHRTWQNAVRTGEFTVSYPSARQVLEGTFAASPRCNGGEKPGLAAVPVVPASEVDGVLVAGSPVQLECRLERTVEGLGTNGLLIGRVVAVDVQEHLLRGPDRDDADVIEHEHLLAYVHPWRFAKIDVTQAFPLPSGFSR